MPDKILENLIRKETERQNKTLDLIASENIVSREVMEILGSTLVNKYSEGYPGKRYYAGNEFIDEIELLAQKRARQAFHLNENWHVNVQPYSGSPANAAVYLALLKPDDLPAGRQAKLMGMGLSAGGHLTHGSKANFSGKIYSAVQYGVNKKGFLDYDEIRKLAKKEKPKIIVCGATAYPRTIDFKKFGQIAKETGAYLMVDISHIAGLIASGVHPSPFPYGDIVTTTTHKTLRGPRGAIIFANKKSPIAKKNKIDIASAVDKAVFPGLQGGPHDNQTAAIAQCLFEANRPEFKKYCWQIVKNAKALANKLQKSGFKLVSGGTDNHLILVDLTDIGISGQEAQDKLEKAGIIANRNSIPFDKKPAFDPSGIRLGTPSLTTRGIKEKEMEKIGELIYRTLIQKEKLGLIKKEVKGLVEKFKIKA